MDKNRVPEKQGQEMNTTPEQNPAAQTNLTLDYRADGSVTYSFPKISKEKSELFSQERLQEAILWSEILGKPVSKRRKRRM
jgi:hypothetical protein